MSIRLGMVGARGYTGEALLRLLANHRGIDVTWLGSRGQAGQPLSDVFPDLKGPELLFQAVMPDKVPEADVIVLALPNGKAAAYVEAVAGRNCRILDISADYRFDDRWTYGLPEFNRAAIGDARRVANPGCYATAAQLALRPIASLLAEAPNLFGVSGFSGAGRTPSPKNDPKRLQDNLMPYALTGHLHEREVSHQLATEVRFIPHVAAFFRGISMTVSARVTRPVTRQDLVNLYESAYQDEPLVAVTPEIPEVSQVQDRCGAIVGGFAVDERDPRRVVMVSCIDNLLKGAASQALQNINLMCGFDELEGIPNE